jgi:hypothetical protein
VGPRAGLDVCEKSRPHRDFFLSQRTFIKNQFLNIQSLQSKSGSELNNSVSDISRYMGIHGVQLNISHG